MKSKFLICFTAMTLFVALAIPLRLAAQDNRDHHHSNAVRLRASSVR